MKTVQLFLFCLTAFSGTAHAVDAFDLAQAVCNAGDEAACKAAVIIAEAGIMLPVAYAAHPERFDERTTRSARECLYASDFRKAAESCADAQARITAPSPVR